MTVDPAILAALQAADGQYAGVEAADGFALHPTGKYPAKVESAQIEVKSNGQIQLFVKFKTDKGSPATWQVLSDFKSEAQVARTKKVLKCLGHTGTFSELATGGTGHLIGRGVELEIKHETYDGTTRERVFCNRAIETTANITPDLENFASQFNVVV